MFIFDILCWHTYCISSFADGVLKYDSDKSIFILIEFKV